MGPQTVRISRADFLTHGVRALRGGRAKWKTLNWNFTITKIANQRQWHIPKGISEISATIKDLNYVEAAIPIETLFNSPIWLVKNQVGLRGWLQITVKLVRCDANCSCGSRHDIFTKISQHHFWPEVLLWPQMLSFLLHWVKIIRNSLSDSSKSSIYYIRALSSLLISVIILSKGILIILI